ncbi:hypothetical protein ACOMHN_047534 [Nucella lapillus]
MQQPDLFLMTQTQASWARSNLGAGLSADCPASSVTPSVYNDHVQPMFHPHMTTQELVPPPEQDSHLLQDSSVNLGPCHQHTTRVVQQQQTYDQQQERQLDPNMTVHMVSKPTGGQVPGAETQKHNTGKKEPETGKKCRLTTSSKPVSIAEKRRCSNPSDWKKTKKKILRDKGEEYVTMKGKLKNAKRVQPIDCTNCRFRCSEKVPEETRQAIHKVYWSLASYERQRAFIAQHVEQNDIKQVKSKTGARREVANSFFFVHNRKEHRVCKAFFTKTLDISSKVVDYTMKKTECGVYVGRDERGRKSPVNKTKPEDSEFIHWHIRSFPTVEASKGKKNKNRKRYLSEDLNVGRMYNLYKDMCEQTGRKVMGIAVYRNFFHQDFNLAFQKPKKEHCVNCKDAENIDKKKTKSDCD